MSIAFAMLLIAGFLLLFPVCLALFGREEAPLLSPAIVMDAIHREHGIECLAFVTAVDLRTALAETATGELFMMFVSGRHFVIRKIRPSLVRLIDAAPDRMIRLYFNDFTTRQREIDLGCNALASVWRDQLRRHLAVR